jgi:hypothetical protein
MLLSVSAATATPTAASTTAGDAEDGADTR